MKILIIGNAIYTFLKRGKNEIIAGVRSPLNFKDKSAIEIDFNNLKEEELLKKLEGL